MKRPHSKLPILPPHLSMDEYVEFIESSIQNSNPQYVARQKAIEEQIVTPFSFARGTPQIDPKGQASDFPRIS